MKKPAGPTDAERASRRHVLELHATIQAAVALGWNGSKPEPEPGSLPSLEDHYQALGLPWPPPVRPAPSAVHLRTRHAIQPVAAALCHLINRGSFHGDDLALRCGDRTVAHNAILMAERVGWIVRGKFDLSVQQRALPSKHHLPGCEWISESGGRWTDPPIGHHWITQTTQWLEVPDVKAMLAEGAP